MIDLNQAIQPVILGQLAGQGEHQISLEGIKRGLHTAGNFIGSLPGIRNTKFGGMLQKGAHQDKVDRAVSEVLDKQSTAEAKLAAAMLPKKMNQLNSKFSKKFGHNWRYKPEAKEEYITELTDVQDTLEARAWTSVYAQEKFGWSPEVSNRLAENIIEPTATEEELVQEVTGRIPRSKGLSKLQEDLTNAKE